jgi:hypothetical protein
VPVRITSGSASSGGSVAKRDQPAGEAAVENGHDVDTLELPAPHRVSGITLAALAAVTGLAAIALGTWAFVVSVREADSVSVVRAAPVYGAAQVVSLLSKPSTERLLLEGSEGHVTLAVAEGGRGVLVLDGLAIAPPGLTYQAWVADPESRPREHIAAGTFTGVEMVVPLTARIPPGWILGVTVERSGGATAPSRGFRFGAQRPSG